MADPVRRLERRWRRHRFQSALSEWGHPSGSGFWTVIVTSALGFAFGLWLLLCDHDAGMGWFAVVTFLVLGIVGARMFGATLRKVRRSERLESSDEFARLPDWATSKLDDLIVPSLQRLGLRKRQVVYLRPRLPRGLTPSVVEDRRRRIFLVIPPDFMSLAVVEREAARFMLSHELGHVAQRDSRLWLFAGYHLDHTPKFLTAFSGLGALLFAVGALGASRNPFSVSMLLVASYASFIFALGCLVVFSHVGRNRRRCEELADVAALICLDGDLEGAERCFSLVGDDVPDRRVERASRWEPVLRVLAPPSHPTAAERLASLRKARDTGRFELTKAWGGIDALFALSLVLYFKIFF